MAYTLMTASYDLAGLPSLSAVRSSFRYVEEADTSVKDAKWGSLFITTHEGCSKRAYTKIYTKDVTIILSHTPVLTYADLFCYMLALFLLLWQEKRAYQIYFSRIYLDRQQYNKSFRKD